MIHKRKHTLNSKIVNVTIMRDFTYRGKLNRMWKMKSVTINDIINTLYKNYKHLIHKQEHDTPTKLISSTFDRLFEKEIP